MPFVLDQTTDLQLRIRMVDAVFRDQLHAVTIKVNDQQIAVNWPQNADHVRVVSGMVAANVLKKGINYLSIASSTGSQSHDSRERGVAIHWLELQRV